jgi:hypothetical protein
VEDEAIARAGLQCQRKYNNKNNDKLGLLVAASVFAAVMNSLVSIDRLVLTFIITA